MAFDLENDIAIVGMACRYPGAPDLEAFWQLLRAGKEGIRHFTESELLESGVLPDHIADPQYVRAYGWLEGIEFFDADFFRLHAPGGPPDRSPAPVVPGAVLART